MSNTALLVTRQTSSSATVQHKSERRTANCQLAIQLSTMPRKTVNKIDSTPAAVSKSAVVPPQRWALSIDFLMKVGEKHVHDLVWDVS
jgi:hypothetical protein